MLKFRHKKTPHLMTEGLKLKHENTNITLYLNLSSKIITKTKEIIVRPSFFKSIIFPVIIRKLFVNILIEKQSLKFVFIYL